ncbi:hypothetical protein DSO57_1017018 [Entomophthora muscae]|uniref:Uncharacterized protein n=1 Tax=Entomophthora muscae TaxID=34485 RepID=A0ACC2RW04_9FUNG|nr:hypothetical protein DSO57_1017018 [Entomophthora muscae]
MVGMTDELRLSVSLVFPYSISQKFRLTYQNNDQDLLNIPKPAKFYSWVMSINLLTTLISHFDIRLEEFTIICKPTTIQFLSHPSSPEELLKPARSRKQLHTGLTFNTEDFQSYKVKEEVGFTLKFKEFKAALTLAKETSAHLGAAFTCGGE